MKGVVFVALSEMIQETNGHRVWNDFVSESKVESQGVYTSTEIYDDKEAGQLLNVISKKLDKTPNTILYIFGRYLIKYFHRKYPAFFNHDEFVNFMSSVGSVIHVEIVKISPQCSPPLIEVKNIGENHFFVHYSSKRKLCSLGHGLMAGAANIYQVNAEITHLSCMNDGNNHCVFEVKYKREM